ncbi:hypothetical protein DL98DRAFT_591173 [Cadophora sp. DSE1049]|nr:hypothetical protein DL98DRAFT_591173 [Cadophora sp. DSE1049]
MASIFPFWPDREIRVDSREQGYSANNLQMVPECETRNAMRKSNTPIEGYRGFTAYGPGDGQYSGPLEQRSESNEAFMNAGSQCRFTPEISTWHDNGSGPRNVQPSSTSLAQSSLGKRAWNRRTYGDDPDDSQNDRARKLAKCDRSKRAGATPSKFACPYFKRDPSSHRKLRSCAGPGWDTVHRVKEHIFRSHARPFQCVRCWSVFKDEESVNKHQRGTDVCEVREEGRVESFDKQQEQTLKCRKTFTDCQTEEQKWYRVYKVLFKRDDESSVPSSPYHEDEALFWNTYYRVPDLDRLQQYISTGLPQTMQTAFRSSPADSLHEMEGWIHSQEFETLVKDCLGQVLRSYKAEILDSPLTLATLTPHGEAECSFRSYASGPASGGPTSPSAARSPSCQHDLKIDTEDPFGGTNSGSCEVPLSLPMSSGQQDDFQQWDMDSYIPDNGSLPLPGPSMTNASLMKLQRLVSRLRFMMGPVGKTSFAEDWQQICLGSRR